MIKEVVGVRVTGFLLINWYFILAGRGEQECIPMGWQWPEEAEVIVFS